MHKVVPNSSYCRKENVESHLNFSQTAVPEYTSLPSSGSISNVCNLVLTIFAASHYTGRRKLKVIIKLHKLQFKGNVSQY